MVTRKCVICGKVFETKGSCKTCSIECRQANDKEMRKKYRKIRYEREKQAKRVKEKKSDSGLLDKEIAKAKALGMSYGKYKAMQFVFREKAEKVANT